MWLAGLALPVWSVVKVGVVVWQPLQSPRGRMTLVQRGVRPRVARACSRCWRSSPHTARSRGRWCTRAPSPPRSCGRPRSGSASLMLAAPSLKPPAVTLAVRVAARAVAVEIADRHVVGAGRAHDRDVGPASGRRWSVAAQAVGHALVRAGHRVKRIVARRGMALRARRVGRDMVGGLGVAGLVGRERRRRGVAAAAIAAWSGDSCRAWRWAASPPPCSRCWRSSPHRARSRGRWCRRAPCPPRSCGRPRSRSAL